MVILPFESLDSLLEKEVEDFIWEDGLLQEIIELPKLELEPRPPLELKTLPPGLCYTFLDGDTKAPIIISG